MRISAGEVNTEVSFEGTSIPRGMTIHVKRDEKGKVVIAGLPCELRLWPVTAITLLVCLAAVALAIPVGNTALQEYIPGTFWRWITVTIATVIILFKTAKKFSVHSPSHLTIGDKHLSGAHSCPFGNLDIIIIRDVTGNTEIFTILGQSGNHNSFVSLSDGDDTATRIVIACLTREEAIFVRTLLEKYLGIRSRTI